MREFFEKYKSIRLYVNLGILFTLFLASLFYLPLSYAAFGVLALMVLFDNLSMDVNYLLVGLPFSFVNRYLSSAAFIGAVLVFLAKFYYIYFVKEKGKVNLVTTFFCALFLFYCLMPTGSYNNNWLLKFAMFFLIIALLAAFVLKPEVFKFTANTRMLAIATIISAIFALPALAAPNVIAIKVVNGNRFNGLMGNPNVYAMLCELTLGCLAYSIVTKKGRWQDLLLFALVSVSAIFTLSKTFILLLLVILIALFIWALKTRWKVTLVCFVVFCGLAVAAYFIKPDFFQTYLNRFIGQIQEGMTFDEVMNKLTTSRWNMWVHYGAFLAANPLKLIFGSGLGAGVLNYEGYVAPYSAHNAYISSVYELGIVGMLLFVLAIVMLMRQLSKKVKISWAIVIPILVVALLWLSEDTIFYIFTI